MIHGIIYLIVNKINGKMYVGQTTQSLKKRFERHAQTNSLIGKAIRKYGRENFRCEILKRCTSKAELNAWEKFFISAIFCKSTIGYNLTLGGDGVVGYKHTDEERAKMSAAHTGTHLSDDTRAKIRVAQIGNKNGLGHCPTAQARAKMALAKKDIPKSPEHCSKVSKTKRSHSPYKNLLSEIDAKQLTYRGLAKLMGLAHQSISRKMRGKRNFTESEISKLVEIFDKPIEYLLARDEE